VTRRRVGIALALVVVSASAGPGAAPASSSRRDPAVTAYLARANTVCRRFAKQLATIPPPADPRSFSDIEASVGKALPVLEAQASAVRAIVPPTSLAARVRALNALVAHSNGYLRQALVAERKRQRTRMGLAYGAWLEASSDAHDAAVELGFRCS